MVASVLKLFDQNVEDIEEKPRFDLKFVQRFVVVA